MFSETLAKLRRTPYFAGVLVACVNVFSAGLVSAHEGHAPLPTKGVQVDVPKGLLTLSPDAQRSLGVQTATAEMRMLANTALAYATLVTPWQGQHLVSPQISGQITKLHVVTGQVVQKGELLAEISSPELEGVRLELKNALKELELSEKQLSRIRTLVESQALPGRDFFEAETKHIQNQNALEIARTKLQSLGFEGAVLEDVESRRATDDAPLMLPLKSPASGLVSHTDLAVGKVVAANEHLFKVTDLAMLWVRIGILERDLGKIKKDQTVELELASYPRETIRTIVALDSVFVDPATRLGTVWAEISNPAGETKYLPGMYGSARIMTSPRDEVLTVPASAILGTGAERYVLVEVAATAKGHEYQRQNVVLGAHNSTYAEIRGGQVYPGDRVVSRGGQILSSFFVLGVLRLSPEGIRNVGLTLEPAEPRAIQEIVEFDGRMEMPPGNVATVSAQLPGVLQRLLVDRGQEVEAGEVIAELSGLRLQDIQLEMLRAHLEAELLSNTLRRLQANGVSQAVAIRRLWETENQRDLAVNRRESAKRTLASLGMSQAQVDSILESRRPIAALPIRSPIRGVVTKLMKMLGESVSADEPLLEVQDLSHPWVQGFVSEIQAPRVRVGTSTRLRLVADPAFVGSGHVSRSAQSYDGDSRTLSIWIELDEKPPRPLQRDQLVRVAAVIGQHQAQLAVPLSAVLREGARAYLFVQKEDGLMERRLIELGPADDRYIGITKGLARGERVVIQGVAELQTTYASIR